MIPRLAACVLNAPERAGPRVAVGPHAHLDPARSDSLTHRRNVRGLSSRGNRGGRECRCARLEDHDDQRRGDSWKNSTKHSVGSVTSGPRTEWSRAFVSMLARADQVIE